MALRRLIDAIIDGTASRQPSHTLDTVYAAINYLAAAEHLCTGCGRPLGSPHADHCASGQWAVGSGQWAVAGITIRFRLCVYNRPQSAHG